MVETLKKNEAPALSKGKKGINGKVLIEEIKKGLITKEIFMGLGASEKVRILMRMKASGSYKDISVLLLGMSDGLESVRKASRMAFEKVIEQAKANEFIIEEARQKALSAEPLAKAAGVYALGLVGKERDFITLVKAYGDSSLEVQLAAKEAINLMLSRLEKGELQKAKSQQVLKLLTADTSAWQKSRCRECIYMLTGELGEGQDSIQILKKGIVDEDQKAKQTALRAMKKLKDKGIAQP
ncbi:MAG: hypothetical protein QW035_04525 [Candidatus Anstonellales archaeon]